MVPDELRSVFINTNIQKLISESYTQIPLNESFINQKRIAEQALIDFMNQGSNKKNLYSYPLSLEHGYRNLTTKESLLLRRTEEHGLIIPLTILAEKMHQLCLEILNEIEIQLELPPATLKDLTHATFENQASIFRAFKYFPTDELAAGAHDDLGLITIILKSNDAALEVLDLHNFQWKNIEETMKDNEAIVIVGESLSSVSNFKVNSCHHRVASHNDVRYSFVYELRMSENAIINLGSKIISGKELLQQLQSSRTSVNGSYIAKTIHRSSLMQRLSICISIISKLVENIFNKINFLITKKFK